MLFPNSRCVKAAVNLCLYYVENLEDSKVKNPNCGEASDKVSIAYCLKLTKARALPIQNTGP